MLESFNLQSKGIKDNTLELVDYSIVVPVYNEEESVLFLTEEIMNVMSGQKGRFEIIFVNDASSDRSASILSELQDRWPEIVRVVNLAERKGQTSAMRGGLDHCLGNIVITMDADLQNDPADIPALLEKIKEGYDCVCGWRKSRQDTPLKAGLSKCGNLLQRLFTGLSTHDVSCTLRAYNRGIIDKVPLNWEGQHRFIPLSLSLQGFKIAEIISNHRVRQFGKSKYSHKRIFRVVKDFFRVLRTKGKG